MSDLNKNIKCQSQEEMFSWLSKNIRSSGNQIAEQGNLIENYIGEYLKFNLDENESFQEMYSIRDSIK